MAIDWNATKAKAQALSKGQNGEFINLTDEWQEISFDMNIEPRPVECKSQQYGTRTKWFLRTTDSKVLTLTIRQFEVFTYGLPETVPDVFTCELKIGIDAKGKPMLKMKHKYPDVRD